MYSVSFWYILQLISDEDYQLCNDTHTEDRCTPCPPNTTNQDIINTSSVDEQLPGICKKIECYCLPEGEYN